MVSRAEKRLFTFTLLVTGLGYFIDSYDAFLFNVMRGPSLGDLSLKGEALTRAGVFILNCQVTGTLFGGIFWGILGDRLGRKKALLGSILAYSSGMLANAFVQDVGAYAAVRALVGFGIAGEVGLGATLVAEIAKTRGRTVSLALFTALGLAGVAAAALSIAFVSWRASCLLGGAGGLGLLVLRHRLFESPLFEALERKRGRQPGLKALLAAGFARLAGGRKAAGAFAGFPRAVTRWICCVFVLAPNFFVTGLLLTLAPEFARAGGVEGAVKANIALAVYFTAAIAGDALSAALSNAWKSHRRVLLLYLAGNMACAVLYISFTPSSLPAFYALAGIFGLFNLWAIATTAAVEQFDTGRRATVTTTSMNVARACLVPMNPLPFSRSRNRARAFPPWLSAASCSRQAFLRLVFLARPTAGTSRTRGCNAAAPRSF